LGATRVVEVIINIRSGDCRELVEIRETPEYKKIEVTTCEAWSEIKDIAIVGHEWICHKCSFSTEIIPKR